MIWRKGDWETGEKYSQASKADRELCRLRNISMRFGFGGRDVMLNVKSVGARLL
jgi:hypothetical protein